MSNQQQHTQYYQSNPFAKPHPNPRTSAYDVYDNYLDDSNHKNDSRISGSGALGLGLMNGDFDDDDEEDERWRRKAAQNGVQAPSSKHSALVAATREPESPPPSYIAAPRPGYAAPVANIQLPSPEPAATRDGNPGNLRQLPAALRIDAQRAQNGIAAPQAQNPFEPPRLHLPQPSPSPVSSTMPHPLQAPITPITPVFARPVRHSPDIKFQEEKEIIRGDKEHTLLPRRGERGDDFWRRFSMVVKEDERKPNKISAWLRKTRDGTNRLGRAVMIIGVALALLALAGIGLGWYVSHNGPDHEQPQAVGGGASQGILSTVGHGTASGIQTSFHVDPTNTVDRRGVGPIPTSTTVVVPRSHRRHAHAQRRLTHGDDVL